jgi:hypothetical protein
MIFDLPFTLLSNCSLLNCTGREACNKFPRHGRRKFGLLLRKSFFSRCGFLAVKYEAMFRVFLGGCFTEVFYWDGDLVFFDSGEGIVRVNSRVTLD